MVSLVLDFLLLATLEISIPDEDAQKWATVDDIVKYIEEKKSLQEAT